MTALFLCGMGMFSHAHARMTTEALSPALRNWGNSFDPRARLWEARWIMATALATGGVFILMNHEKDELPKGEISILFSDHQNPIIDLQKEIATFAPVDLRNAEQLRFEFRENAVGSLVILKITLPHQKTKTLPLGNVPAHYLIWKEIKELGIPEDELSAVHLTLLNTHGFPVETKSIYASYPMAPAPAKTSRRRVISLQA